MSTIVNVGYSVNRCISLCLEQFSISQALEFHNNTDSFLYTLVGESRDFTRMLKEDAGPLVLCNDRFNKLQSKLLIMHTMIVSSSLLIIYIMVKIILLGIQTTQ